MGGGKRGGCFGKAQGRITGHGFVGVVGGAEDSLAIEWEGWKKS